MSGSPQRIDVEKAFSVLAGLLFQYDNLDKYCKEFLGFLLCFLLTLDEIHLLDRFAMHSPQERLLAELKRRGLRADVGLNELKAAIKLTLPPLNSPTQP